MSRDFVLAFDIGTGGIKAVVTDLDGNLRSVAASPLRLYGAEQGFAEHDPEDLWKCLCACSIKALIECGLPSSGLRGVVSATYWKGILPVSADGKPLCRMILWLDGRAGKEARFLNDRLNSDFMSPIEYWPKLLWLKNNLPEIYEKCAYILDANAFLKYKLTGEFASDYNNCFIYSKNEKLQKRYDGVLRAAGLDKKKFALPTDPSDIAGKVTPEAAAESGIPAGVPVFGGTTDLVAVAIGSGCGTEHAEYGQGHIYLGSSGWLGTVVPEGKHMFLPFRDGTDLALAAMQSAGLAFDWGARCFYGAKTSVGSRVYDEIESESGQIAPGCGRLLCVPWIHEETSPHDANARCVFFHAESGHTRAHFQTAIKEGVAFQLRQSSEILKGYGIPASPSLRAVGGCVASPDWMRRIADIMQTPIQVLANARHAGAVGAAFCALSGLGVFRSLAEARETTEIECTYEPRVKTAGEYAKLYEVWKELENALTHCNALLADQKEKFT